jgi:hypothetical protein
LQAGLFSVALVVIPERMLGRYPTRCPLVFGLSSFEFSKATACLALFARLENYTKVVEQRQLRFCKIY